MTDEEALALNPGDVVMYEGMRGVVIKSGRYGWTNKYFVHVRYSEPVRRKSGITHSTGEYDHTATIKDLTRPVTIEGFEL